MLAFVGTVLVAAAALTALSLHHDGPGVIIVIGFDARSANAALAQPDVQLLGLWWDGRITQLRTDTMTRFDRGRMPAATVTLASVTLSLALPGCGPL
jgi:hypothetical protein